MAGSTAEETGMSEVACAEAPISPMFRVIVIKQAELP